MRQTRTRSGATLAFLLTIAALGVSPFADGDDSRSGSVWVVNRDLGELAIFDAETGAVITTLLVGAGAHDICISERAHKAFITAETINMVTTVDTGTLAIDSIAIGPLPHHVEPCRDGRTVYVTLASHTANVGAPETPPSIPTTTPSRSGPRAPSRPRARTRHTLHSMARRFMSPTILAMSSLESMPRPAAWTSASGRSCGPRKQYPRGPIVSCGSRLGATAP
jgi:hypothetical protein